MYKEYAPHPLLCPYIETYWTFAGHITGQINHKVLPDGCMDILFSAGDTTGEKRIQYSQPRVIGTMTTCLDRVYTGYVQIAGIRFRPGGLTAFTRIPLYEFTDRKVELSLVDTLFDHRFYETCPLSDPPEIQLHYIETYLISKLASLYPVEKQIIHATTLIQLGRGVTPVPRIAVEVCLSPRQFERRFKQAVGISPKAFSRITRFRYMLGRLQDNSSESLLSTAIDCGYYDHTHLIKDFKILAGCTPRQWQAL